MMDDNVKLVWVLYGNFKLVSLFADRETAEEWKAYYIKNYPHILFRVHEAGIVERKPPTNK